MPESLYFLDKDTLSNSPTMIIDKDMSIIRNKSKGAKGTVSNAVFKNGM